MPEFDIVLPNGTPARAPKTAQADIGGSRIGYLTDPSVGMKIGLAPDGHVPGAVVAEQLTNFGIVINALCREIVMLRKELQTESSENTIVDEKIH